MALTPDGIADLVTLTQNREIRDKWTDISLSLQDYVSAAILNKKKIVESGGPNISFRVQVKNTGNAVESGLYAQDQTAVEDVMTTGTVPWSMVKVSYSYDVYEPVFQSDRETIIREILVRRHDARNSLAELLETQLWSAPASSTATSPMGIPFWIQKDATTTVGGAFNGGNPSTHSSGCAGISSSTYANWSNWAFGFTNVTVDDAVKKMKKALVFTRFRAPDPHNTLGYGGARREAFTTYTVVEQLERLAETRNDNLGSDVARFMGRVTVGGVPVRFVPYLDTNDSTDPIYGVDWDVFRPFVLRGANLVEGPPKQAPKQDSVRNVFTDLWYNYICLNRRACWVGSTS